MPFGGMLGSTFNFVFENQLEKLQDGDRFYYLERTAGLDFNAELESNSFAKLIMANTDATHLPGARLLDAGLTLEVDPTKQFTGLGADGRADPTGGDPLVPLVIRDNPDTAGPDTNYLQLHRRGPRRPRRHRRQRHHHLQHGDDTLWGDGGNDRLDGGYGNDQLRGGAGDDIITDLGGDDNIQGGDGNDVIHGGNGINLIIGGFGSDFIVTGEDANEGLRRPGQRLHPRHQGQRTGHGQRGRRLDRARHLRRRARRQLRSARQRPDRRQRRLHRQRRERQVQRRGRRRHHGRQRRHGRPLYRRAPGFDWATFKDDTLGVTIDMTDRFFDQPPVPGSGASVLTRFDIVEGLSGSAHDDVLQGDDADAAALPRQGAQGSVLTNFELINGPAGHCSETPSQATDDGVDFFDGGNIILGGDGSDIIEGRGGNDLIDGDAWLNVRISVRGYRSRNGTGRRDRQRSTAWSRLIPFMLDGTYNPGQLQIVREILYCRRPQTSTPRCSPAPLGELHHRSRRHGGYEPTSTSDDIITVTDTRRHATAPTRSSTSSGCSSPIRPSCSAASTTSRLATDDQRHTGRGPAADGVDRRRDRCGQRQATNPTAPSRTRRLFLAGRDCAGSGVFKDILTDFTAGEVARVEGPTFTPGDAEAGLQLRVRAVYKDANGVLEEVFSAPTGPSTTSTIAPTARCH